MLWLPRWFVLLMLTAIVAHGAETPQEPESLNARIRSARSKVLDGSSALAFIDLLAQSAKIDKPTEEDHHEFVVGFAMACRQAEAAHFPLLAKIFTSLPLESTVRERVHKNIVDLAFRVEMEQFPAASIKISLPPENALPHPAPAHLTPELTAAWRKFLAAHAPFAALKTSATSLDKRPGFYSDRATYWKAIDDLLLNRAPVKAEELLVYQWDGGCCVSLDHFFSPTSIMATLALIREQRFSEAIGAAFASDYRMSFDEEVRHLRKFLSLCGFDPTLLLAGALVAHDIAVTPETAYLDLFGTRTDLLHTLCADKSARSASFVTEITELAKSNSQRHYIRALSAFLQKNNNASHDKIIAALERIATKTSIEVLTSIAQTLGSGPEHPAAKPLLHKLLSHPSESVREAAFTTLNKWGVPVEKPAPSSPVQFLIRTNGKPLQNAPLRWEARTGSYQSASNQVKTGGNGIVSIPRDVFIDREKPIDSLVFSTPTGTAPTDPLFVVNVPIPEPLEGVHPVEINMTPLDVNLVFPPGRVPQETDKISVEITPVFESPPPAFLQHHFEISPTNSILLTGLQTKKYNIVLTAPGAARFASKLDLVESKTFTATLEPGAEIQVKIIPPEPWHPTLIRYDISRVDGKPFEMSFKGTGRYQGLPVGEYILRIPPSSTLRSNARWPLPLEVDYEGAERKFRIDAETPAVLDLGEIRLKGKKAEPPPSRSPLPTG